MQQRTAFRLSLLVGLIMTDQRTREEEEETSSSIQFIPALDGGEYPLSWCINNTSREDGEVGRPGIFLAVEPGEMEISISIRGEKPVGFSLRSDEDLRETADYIDGYL